MNEWVVKFQVESQKCLFVFNRGGINTTADQSNPGPCENDYYCQRASFLVLRKRRAKQNSC